MITIYQYDDKSYFTGNTKEQSEKTPIPPQWTHKAPSGESGERFVGNVWQVVAFVEPIPQSISRRQGKQQLVLSGLDEQVEVAIDSIPDATEKKLTRIWYDDAETWERDNPQLQSLASALSLTSTQVDQLFQEASSL